MTELASITLENEMDLTLAYKRSIITAGMLGLTVSTQTAFATAVSEVCREVIDKAISGVATLGTIADSGRFFMTAQITCKVEDGFDRNNGGIEYARKLVPVLDVTTVGPVTEIILKLGIPRATRIDQRKITAVKRQIEEDGPVSAYEEVKQKNAQLAGLNQQHEMALEKASYLDQQKREFLSIASHELNSPLTVLRSYAQIALKIAGDGNPALHNYLIKIEAQSKKLVTLVRQLMDISKFEHGDISYDLQKITANAFFTDVIDDIRLWAKTHELTMRLGPDCGLLADTMRLEQVLYNLVGNAAKYSEPGSNIKITTDIDGTNLVVTVTDQGIGMSAETQQRVFEKFYRDKQIEKKYSGLGMGLYIASRIVNDHKGALSVKSEEGKGSAFYFTIPLHTA